MTGQYQEHPLDFANLEYFSFFLKYESVSSLL